MLKEETLAQVGRREYEEPEGEVLQYISSGNNTITVLTRVDSDNEEVEPPFDPAKFNVGSLEGKLSEVDPTEEERAALIEEEQQNKNRTTAIAALKSQ